MTITATLLGLSLVLSQIQLQLGELKSKEDKTDTKNFIMECESGGNPKAVNWNDAKITGQPSRGLYQFQPKTFYKFGKIYKVFSENWTYEDAIKKIHDPAYNAAVAHAMIDDGLLDHWQNCTSKYRKIK